MSAMVCELVWSKVLARSEQLLRRDMYEVLPTGMRLMGDGGEGGEGGNAQRLYRGRRLYYRNLPGVWGWESGADDPVTRPF